MILIQSFYFFIPVFNKVSFIIRAIRPCIFAPAMELVVDKLSFISGTWRMCQLAFAIHFISYPLSLISYAITCGVFSFASSFYWTLLCCYTFSFWEREYRMKILKNCVSMHSTISDTILLLKTFKYENTMKLKKLKTKQKNQV